MDVGLLKQGGLNPIFPLAWLGYACDQVVKSLKPSQLSYERLS